MALKLPKTEAFFILEMDMEDITIRAAQPTFKDGIFLMKIGSIPTCHAFGCTLKRGNAAFFGAAARHGGSGEKRYIICLRGKPVGFMRLSGIGENEAWVSELVLLPAFWRKGIATRALQWAAGRHGRLFACIPHNTPAYHCFTHAGFSVAKRAAHYSQAACVLESGACAEENAG